MIISIPIIIYKYWFPIEQYLIPLDCQPQRMRNLSIYHQQRIGYKHSNIHHYLLWRCISCCLMELQSIVPSHLLMDLWRGQKLNHPNWIWKHFSSNRYIWQDKCQMQHFWMQIYLPFVLQPIEPMVALDLIS